ncbi:oligosaccharide flippase family protein [Flavobacterium rhizosphaerae]|uniref:Oligosaccharide flippase family protein n=1 Tax=Flavobacterium rhizosphaerae TaxID=3163298 RepID=A0ABW8YZ26_9FLAO
MIAKATQNAWLTIKKLSAEQTFFAAILLVNAGNYLYNLVLGRLLGPAAFAEAALLITLLLILSFIGMTFQIVTAKFSVLYSGRTYFAFLKFISKIALWAGTISGLAIVAFSQSLENIFHTESALMFVIFGAGLPLYFIMSVNRGVYQGREDFKKLSVTYQLEMFSRLAITFALLYTLHFINPSLIVAGGITISLVFGLMPLQKKVVINAQIFKVSGFKTTPILSFFAVTAFYELTQIIINNSDILLVKHYFESEQAGLYASLALIGRVVYFVAWMFVMLMLPKVIRLKKEGLDTRSILMKYVAFIAGLSACIVLGAFLFPVTVVKLMFGAQYVGIAPLLWQYALATSVFAIANIFAYYFLSLGQYIPVIISAVLGLTQIALIIFYHNSLQQVVVMQILAMVCLLFFQLGYFFYQNRRNIHRN